MIIKIIILSLHFYYVTHFCSLLSLKYFVDVSSNAAAPVQTASIKVRHLNDSFISIKEKRKKKIIFREVSIAYKIYKRKIV